MSNVLLIEPDVVLARIQAEFFQNQGCKVSWTANAQEAVILADKQRPDIVLLEIMLPNRNGIEFLYEFRSHSDWSDIPIIIATHLPKKSFDVEDSFWTRLGVKKYLYKPSLTLEKLYSAVDSFIGVL